MSGKVIFIWIIIILKVTSISGQVRVRLFSLESPESVVFSVTRGEYELNAYNGETIKVTEHEPVIISKFNEKLAVKTRSTIGFICDSVSFTSNTGDDSFSLLINVKEPVRQNYSGDLQCFPDLETIVLINTCDIEKYIAGVVRAEGGTGKNIEYFKTQAVIARTYLYNYFDKHIADRYNVCDNIHCQAFTGLSSDSVINRAGSETRDIVIMAPDSTLIISAFHSNCGGETSSSEDVWLTSQQYLKRVVDPYCLTSKNARWEKSLSLNDWLGFIKRLGYNGISSDPPAFNFAQKTRLTNYKTGSFTIPFRTIRTEMNLRSTFFSVITESDSIKLEGRGYGHGVGLCQEGAMVMADKGFNFKQIINFYYTGVIVSDIKNAVFLSADTYAKSP